MWWGFRWRANTIIGCWWVESQPKTNTHIHTCVSTGNKQSNSLRIAFCQCSQYPHHHHHHCYSRWQPVRGVSSVHWLAWEKHRVAALRVRGEELKVDQTLRFQCHCSIITNGVDSISIEGDLSNRDDGDDDHHGDHGVWICWSSDKNRCHKNSCNDSSAFFSLSIRFRFDGLVLGRWPLPDTCAN